MSRGSKRKAPGRGRLPAAPRPLPWTRKLVYSFLPLLALLIGIEGICRLFPYRDTGGTVAGFAVPDPDLIWRLAPRATGPYRTNDLGLRDGPYRADADVKVLLLGDSVAWGDAVFERAQIFPTRLERDLAARDPARSYEVINAGVPGYSTFQQATYLELYGLALEPDLIVLQFCLNDVVERYHTVARFGGDNVFLGVDTRAGMSGMRGFLMRHSAAFERFYRYLQSRSRSREALEVRSLARDEATPAREDAWAQVASELDQIRAASERAGLPLLLVIAPYRFQLEAPERLRQPQDRLIAWANRNRVPYVDLLPGMASAQRSGDHRSLFNDPSHFSEAGHEHVARLLLPVISGLIPQR